MNQNLKPVEEPTVFERKAIERIASESALNAGGSINFKRFRSNL